MYLGNVEHRYVLWQWFRRLPFLLQVFWIHKAKRMHSANHLEHDNHSLSYPKCTFLILQYIFAIKPFFHSM